ncbi:ATP-binding protein [Nocardia caishijiensis]|uniref:AAA ATPase-like protein n=1 Tax=Nocardia caishijiensis TaxID=184756 RepID=A0ABQ6YIR1_9NOCA|nr:ATP-binding protein [Nocardia caishijiensis]KAF0845341.1 AAA ATPase-like protein [Nocardia caishijiensis]
MTTPPPTVADRLRAARRRRFVGRTGEVELFRTALAAEEPPFTVLFLHGPGGIGKTALLTELREIAETAGVRTAWIDGRTSDPAPETFHRALDPGDNEFVLFVDTFERLTPIEDWLRADFLPGLPTRALVVVAGRNQPAAAWTADSGWQELLRVLSLRNLAPDDARAYLCAAGVAEDAHERILTLTHGHPLALSLLVDVVRQTSAQLPASLLEAPDAVRALLERFVDSVPGPRHRAALEVCAHVRHTTEALLRAALGEPDCADVFAWLRGLAIIEQGPLGLAPHDIARDVLDADLRWRDPSSYLDIHQRVRAHLLGRLDSAAHDAPSVADLVFLHRHNPTISGYWDWSSFGRAFPDRFRPTDREAVLAMTKRHQGPEQAELVDFWLARQPDRFVAVRGSGSTPIGFFCRLALHEATEADLAADPGTRGMWDHACRYGRTRPDEPVYAGRFLVDAEADQLPSPTMNTVTAFSTHAWLSQRGAAWDFIGAFAESESWEPFMRHIDFHHATAYTVGGRRYAVYAHDWRRVGIAAWLELTNDRVVGPPLPRPEPPEPELVLSHQEFTDAVRAALREWKNGGRLDRNPLHRSRVVRARSASGDGLRDLITDVVETLRADPRGAKLHRVLDRTYFRPAPTQERAAEVLGLPFSTYRRHLTQAIERVVAELWERELYGARPSAPE